LPELAQKPSLPGQETPWGNAMDQPLKSPGQSGLDDAFHTMFGLSRSEPAPTLRERLDRLARLRAVIADNEARFDQAISADFGHRSTTETTIAETMLVLGEIKHAAKHLKKWMAPQRFRPRCNSCPPKTA
jgi:coniferyl-aldehyde dehydrogenase